MRSVTVLLPDEFVDEVDQTTQEMPGVRSRSAALHLLAVLGLRILRDEAPSARMSVSTLVDGEVVGVIEGARSFPVSLSRGV
jgi:hypothetical protein